MSIPPRPVRTTASGLQTAVSYGWTNGWERDKSSRLLRCGHCRQTFSERRGTALEEARLSAAEGKKIVAPLQEGWGIRRTVRLTGHARSTVARYTLVAGAHARAVQDKTMRGLSCTEGQADEKWAFVGKKEAYCDAEDKEQGLGDCWDHDIIDVASRAVIVNDAGTTAITNTYVVDEYAQKC